MAKLTMADLQQAVEMLNKMESPKPRLLWLFKPKNKTVHHLGIFTRPIKSIKVKGGHRQLYEIQ